MKNLRLLVIPVLMAFFMSCDSNRQNATLGNSKDTTHIEGAAVSPTVGADSAKNDSTNSTQGNADPSGSIKKSNK